MKNLTIGQIADAFKEKFAITEIYDDIELQFIWQRISEKISVYGISWHYKPQGEMLKLLKTHLPHLFQPQNPEGV